MLPSFTRHDSPYGCLAYLVGKCEVSLAITTRMAKADLDYVSSRQPCVRVTFASCHTSFVRSISGVVACCASEQVRRVTARRVIAGMARLRGSIKRPDLLDERVPMGSDLASVVKCEKSVTVAVSGGFPRPAFIRPKLIDKRPKALCFGYASGSVRAGFRAVRVTRTAKERRAALLTWDRLFGSLKGHRESFSLGVTPRAVAAAPGHFRVPNFTSNRSLYGTDR